MLGPYELANPVSIKPVSPRDVMGSRSLVHCAGSQGKTRRVYAVGKPALRAELSLALAWSSVS